MVLDVLDVLNVLACFGTGHPRGASKHQSGHGTVTWRCILQDSLDEETE